MYKLSFLMERNKMEGHDHEESRLSLDSKCNSEDEEYYSARETLRTPSEELRELGGDSTSITSESSEDKFFDVLECFADASPVGDEIKSGARVAMQGLVEAAPLPAQTHDEDLNALCENLDHIRKMVDDRDIEDALNKLHPVHNTNYDTQGRHGCIEGTRTSILDELLCWSRDPLAPPIFWLSGMAGTGKTTIAWSFCDRLHSHNLLGGSFFCSSIGPSEHADIARVIPTLAYHLAHSFDAYKFAVADQLDKSPDIAQKRISEQLDVLFQRPFSTLSRTGTLPFVLIIDALDECLDKDATATMIQLLISASSTLPIKFFVSSRPERHIRTTQLSHHDHSRVLRLHEIEQTMVDHDISIYLTKHLSSVPHSSRDTETLVRLANGLFIFASTSVGYITRRNSAERLERLTRLAQPTALSTKPLDDMYTLIIDEASGDMECSELVSVTQILSTILALRSRISINGLSEFLGVEPRYLRDALEHLHAVLYVPEQDGVPGLNTLHTSFGDFLTNPERAPSRMVIDVSFGHVMLARGCFNAIYLGEICSEVVYFKSTYLHTSKASDALVYAAEEWSYHAEQTNAPQWIEAKKFLAWRNANCCRTPMEELWQQHRDLANVLQGTVAEFNVAKKKERQNETATFDELRRRHILAKTCQQIMCSVQSQQGFQIPLWPGVAVDFTLKTVERDTENYSSGGQSGNNACTLSQRTIEQTPDGHCDKPRLLSNLSSQLMARYDSNNIIYHDNLMDALIFGFRAIVLATNGDQSIPCLLENLSSIGVAFQTRFHRRNDLDDLERAILALQVVVDFTPDDHRSKPMYLDYLGTSLKNRSDRLGNLEDIEAAIAAQRRAVALTPDGHPSKPISLNNFGISLQRRFGLLGNLNDVEDAIAAQRCAVNLTPDGHLSQPMYFNNLGISLESRFRRLGNLEDVEDAIAAQRHAVDLTPDGHPSKPTYLNNLGISLENRFWRLGNLRDIEDAITAQRHAVDLTSDDRLSKPMYLDNLGISLRSRFGRLGNLEDVESAIAAQRRAVNLTPDGHLSKPMYFNNLGISLLSRFGRFGNLEDIENAITMQRCAVDLTPDSHPSKPAYLNHLGISLESRFWRFGNPEDVEAAIVAQRRAVDLTPDGHVKKPIYLDNLGTSLGSRFGQLGDLEDIEAAITAQRRAVNLIPDGHPSKPISLNNLGISLRSRFRRLRNLEDIESAIVVQRRVVDLTPDGHAKKAIYLDNLGSSFRSRFERLGNLVDAEAAIAAQLRAVELTPDSHPNKPTYLNNLGLSLRNRFEQLGNLEDAEDAIAAQCRAVDLTPDGHVKKPAYLNNLGSSLVNRFEQLGDLKDAEDAIAAQRRAIDLTPDGHVKKPTYLNNLGSSLGTRFWRLGNLEDVQSAIEAQHRAIDLTPDGHPSKPMYVNNLGISLLTRFDRTGDLNDLEQAIESKRRAVDLTPDGHPDKPGRLSNLGNGFFRRFERHGELGDLERGIDASRRAVNLTPDNYPDKLDRLNNLGSALMKRFDRLGGLGDLEQAIVSKRRAVDLAPHDHPDRPSHLNNLGTALQTRFDRLGEVDDLEQAIVLNRRAVDLTPHGHPDKPLRLIMLAKALLSRRGRGRDMLDTVSEGFILLLRAAEQQSGPPTVRLKSVKYASNWSLIALRAQAGNVRMGFLFRMYEIAFELIPQVIWLGKSIGQRYEELVEIGKLVNGAAATAIARGDHTRAVEWLDQGRSIVWGQLLQLRNPIDDLHTYDSIHGSNFAETLRLVSSRLEDTGYGDGESVDGQISSRIRLEKEYQGLLAKVRALHGFENFLLPKKYGELIHAANDGLVVIINIHSSRCDALVVSHSQDHPLHIPLPNLSLELVDGMRSQFIKALEQAGTQESAGIRASSHASDRDRGLRPHGFEDKSGLAKVLARLWSSAIFPIVHALEGELRELAVDSLPHITWCATGPLAFLPIHAAGGYGSPIRGGLKLSDIVVSSYTTTLSALLRPPLEHLPDLRSPSMKVLAISQPETPGLSPLPGAREEVANLRRHFPGNTVIHLDRTDATVNAVQKAMSQHGQLVHLACHGIQDVKNPRDSSFALQDGKLKLSEIMSRSGDNAVLAFLSACQTAIGDEKLPDEAVHLAAGMLSAGYRSVIGTMWSIGDRDAPVVADEFYRHLKGDEGAAGGRLRAAYALHEAVKVLRDKVGELNFVRWAPFVHFGL